MENWNKIQASLANLQLGDRAKAVGKSATSTFHMAKEATGAVSADSITELPAQYRDLEARLDARKSAYESFLKVHRVFAISTYDYPYDISDRLSGVTSSFSSVALAASSLLKQGSSSESSSVEQQTKTTDPKTLPHAISRSGLQASTTIRAAEPNAPLQRALDSYGRGFDRVGRVRLDQDNAICEQFLAPWQDVIGNKIALAMKARQGVRAARLELDVAKQALANAKATNPRRDQMQRELDAAQDDFAAKLEHTTSLIQTALDDAEGLKALERLVTAQFEYHRQAAEALGKARQEIAGLR